MKPTLPFLMASGWEWLTDYLLLVACQEEGGGKKRGGGVAEGVGLGLESESESWGD